MVRFPPHINFSFWVQGAERNYWRPRRVPPNVSSCQPSTPPLRPPWCHLMNLLSKSLPLAIPYPPTSSHTFVTPLLIVVLHHELLVSLSPIPHLFYIYVSRRLFVALNGSSPGSHNCSSWPYSIVDMVESYNLPPMLRHFTTTGGGILVAELPVEWIISKTK